ncbi:MAG: 5-keto-4-deoxy-D-glucarate aldolase [Prosthecobacter sp.]|nr:5-keto-4-deoxy-D-glucarate aldolase [Prosthecobacter sp.]
MKPHIGTFLSLGSPAVAELAAECGFDWVLIDLEHGCESEAALPNQLRALSDGTLAIVRVSAPHSDLIGRVLDWGAHGIMVPHVNTAAEAEHCVRCAHYPPRGHRGVSRTVRAYGYGMRLPGDHTPPRPVILAQIETVEGVANAEAIAAVEGIDALFIGPADLSFDLRARQSPKSFDECVTGIVSAAHSHGKGSGILVRHADDKEKLKSLGFTWLAMDSDLSLVREGFRKNLETARSW